MNNQAKYYEAVKYAYDLAMKQEKELGFGTSGASSVKNALGKWRIKEPIYDKSIDWKMLLYQIKLDLLLDIDISILCDLRGHASLERNILRKLTEYITEVNLIDDVLAMERLENHQVYERLIREFNLKRDFRG